MSKNPIRGNPSEFERLEELFCRIRVRTEDLESDLRSIALGTSRDFRGEAADTFSEDLTALAPALGEVPDIAHQVERIFCYHKNQLVQLQRAADSAVARAETRWNEQRRADTTHDHISSDLSRVITRLLFTPPWDDEERARLVCRKEDLEGDERVARARLDRANDNVAASEEELRNLAEDEEELNKRTANELKSVDVGILADPSLLDRLISFAVDVVKFLSDPVGSIFDLISTEILQLIRAFLDVVVFALTVVGLILEFIPGIGTLASVIVAAVAAGFALIKLGVSIELYNRGVLSDFELGMEFLGFMLALVGIIPFGELLSVGGKALDIGIPSLGIVAGLPSIVDSVQTIGDWIEGAGEDGSALGESEWQGCTATIPSSDSGESFGTYTIDLPDVDVVSALDGTLGIPDIDIGPFTADISLISVPDIGTLEGMPDILADPIGPDVSFDNLVDFVYEMDLDFEFGDFEFTIESHFDFSPPEVVFADFYRSYEEKLRPLLVPCELGTAL